MRLPFSSPAFPSVTLCIWVVCIVLQMICTGCSDSKPDRVRVAGKVTIDAQPLKKGILRFIPVGGGRPSIANIQEDGTFDFGDEGVVIGKQRIEVIANEQVGTGYKWHAPEEYSNNKTSGLEEEVTTPTENLEIKLTWKGKQPKPVRVFNDDSKNLNGKR